MHNNDIIFESTIKVCDLFVRFRWSKNLAHKIESDRQGYEAIQAVFHIFSLVDPIHKKEIKLMQLMETLSMSGGRHGMK